MSPKEHNVGTQLFRVASLPLGEYVLFPREVIHKGNGIKKAEWLMSEPSCTYGLIIVISHFSKRDPLEAVQDIVFESPILRKRQIVAPMSYHQVKPYVHTITNMYGARIYPVVNNDTVEYYHSLPVEKRPNPVPRKGKGLPEYIKGGLEVLSEGGILIIAPQSGRRETLGEPQVDTSAMQLLTNRAVKNNITNLAFLYVGLGIPNQQSYERKEVGGYNFGKTFTVTIGDTLTLSDIQSQISDKDISMDQFAYKQLSNLVPNEYK